MKLLKFGLAGWRMGEGASCGQSSYPSHTTCPSLFSYPLFLSTAPALMHTHSLADTDMHA